MALGLLAEARDGGGRQKSEYSTPVSVLQEYLDPVYFSLLELELTALHKATNCMAVSQGGGKLLLHLFLV